LILYYACYRLKASAKSMLIPDVMEGRYRHVEARKSREQDVGTGKARREVDHH
jgi:hypothetical protein